MTPSYGCLRGMLDRPKNFFKVSLFITFKIRIFLFDICFIFREISSYSSFISFFSTFFFKLLIFVTQFFWDRCLKRQMWLQEFITLLSQTILSFYLIVEIAYHDWFLIQLHTFYIVKKIIFSGGPHCVRHVTWKTRWCWYYFCFNFHILL